jgi:hypothetical protein
MRAISERRAFDSFDARAFPPFEPWGDFLGFMDACLPELW